MTVEIHNTKNRSRVINIREHLQVVINVLKSIQIELGTSFHRESIEIHFIDKAVVTVDKAVMFPCTWLQFYWPFVNRCRILCGLVLL